MKKTSIMLILVICVLFTHTVTFATAQADTSKRQHMLAQIEEFDRQYQSNNGDAIKAVDAMINNDSSLERVGDYIVSSYKVVDGTLKAVDSKSAQSDITFTDQMVHDSDWGTYVYYGTWRWNTAPNDANLQPWDVIGVYSTKPNEVSPLEYYVNCYNSRNSRVAYYNGGSITGDIAKGVEVTAGAGFWINDKTIVQGNMSVPLEYTSSSSTAKVMQYYSHSYTTTNVTGIGLSIHLDGGGFEVDWQENVLDWAVTSPGKRISQVQK